MPGGIVILVVVGVGLIVAIAAIVLSRRAPARPAKPDASEALKMLRDGNTRFQMGESRFPHLDPARRALAARASQSDYAVATILSCSDSRVPVEAIFDAGIMDLFVVRVAGNVCNVDEAGCIEYGLAHVHTPLLIVLGHSQCGAITAVAKALAGQPAPAETNIGPLVRSIEPAVRRAMDACPGGDTKSIVEAAAIENIWQSMENLFLLSPSVRSLVAAGKVKPLGAVYRLESGAVEWLDETIPGQLLARVNENPQRVE